MTALRTNPLPAAVEVFRNATSNWGKEMVGIGRSSAAKKDYHDLKKIKRITMI